MADEYGTSESLSQSLATSPLPEKPSVIQNIFLGPNGIRAGWKLLIFVFVVFLVGRGLNFTIRHTPPVRDWLKSQQGGAFSPVSLIATEGLQSILLFVCVGIMGLIEKRSLADYGLPLNQAFGRRFWQGVPLGFATLSLLLAIMAALHGISFDGVALGGPLALRYGALYFIGFIFVGFFEEFSFRGYLQSTLGSGIG